MLLPSELSHHLLRDDLEPCEVLEVSDILFEVENAQRTPFLLLQGQEKVADDFGFGLNKSVPQVLHKRVLEKQLACAGRIFVEDLEEDLRNQ